MKIFAKRKRKAASSKQAGIKQERTTFASDPVVEELLNQDPSTWNSKQKRMINRYQKRKAEAGEKEEPDKPETEEKASEETVDAKNASQKGEEESSSSSKDDDSSYGDSSGDDEKKDEDDGQNDKNQVEEIEDAAKTPKEEEIEDAAKTPKEVEKEESAETDGKVDPSHEIFKLLDQLNSKMKRTLTRKLDRQGATALREVEEEAKRLLGKSTSAEDESRKRGHDQVEESSGQKSKKKKKSKVDLSSLPPEERLRREEQRKLQKEAAERRARGEVSTGRHPLNSERRRANRRKPKWKNTFKKEEKKNHSASGFMVRKDKVSR